VNFTRDQVTYVSDFVKGEGYKNKVVWFRMNFVIHAKLRCLQLVLWCNYIISEEGEM